uniref:hypothetical protein n=1 Tax=Halomonas sp. TaxID=1486246 RepID=UPI00260218EC|nr:hypothetical protein [Halomonas sp.]
MNPIDIQEYQIAKRVVGTIVGGASVLLLLSAFLVVLHQDRAMEAAIEIQYCSEVSIWRAEADRGIPAIDRTGHPDYRGIADRQCPGIRTDLASH